MKQLPNGVVNRPSRNPELRFAGAICTMFPQPVMHKRFNISWEFVPVTGSRCACELPKSYEDGNAEENVPGRIVVLSQPLDIALYRIADPAGADSVDSSRTDKVAF